jgi:hypothetical protein
MSSFDVVSEVSLDIRELNGERNILTQKRINNRMEKITY